MSRQKLQARRGPRTTVSKKSLLATYRAREAARAEHARKVTWPYLNDAEGVLLPSRATPAGRALFDVRASPRSHPSLLRRSLYTHNPPHPDLQAQVVHGFALFEAAFTAALAPEAAVAYTTHGYVVLPRVAHAHLLRLIDAESLHRPHEGKLAFNRHRKDFAQRHLVAECARRCLGAFLALIEAPASVIAAITRGQRDSALQIETLTCIRGLKVGAYDFPVSHTQTLHRDLHCALTARMRVRGGVVTGAGVNVMLACESAASGSYVAGSHDYGRVAAREAFPAAVAVAVPAGAALVSSPFVLHYGGAGAALPPGLTHRSALFLCAHQALPGKAAAAAHARAPKLEVSVGGELQYADNFGSADYNNTATGRRRGQRVE